MDITIKGMFEATDIRLEYVKKKGENPFYWLKFYIPDPEDYIKDDKTLILELDVKTTRLLFKRLNDINTAVKI